MASFLADPMHEKNFRHNRIIESQSRHIKKYPRFRYAI